MTPEPALWNWRSCGLESGGASKKRRKKGSSSRGLRWPGSSLIVPRVAMLTTAGETRLTIGAREGIGAASATVEGRAAEAGAAKIIAGAARSAAASAAAAKLTRRFIGIPCPSICYRRARRGRTSSRPASEDRQDSAQYYTEDCAWAGPLGGFHRDPVRLHLRHLRNCDLQHTIDELRFDVLRVRRIGQAETALEFPRNALYPAIAFARLALRIFALSANGQHALIGRDFHRFRIDTGQIHVQHELVRFLVNIHRRQPSAGICGRRQRRAEQAIDVFLEPADKCPGLITYDGHCKYSY